MTTTREAALEDALRKLEQANDAACGARPQHVYLAMVDAGMSDCLLELDEARREAREALSTPATEPQGLAHIVDYTNWRGETARRVIRPIRMWWGKTEWHPEEQWMLTAWDCEKDAIRNFAWQDMRPVQNPATSAAARPAPQPAADTRVVTVEQLQRWVYAVEGWTHVNDNTRNEILAIIGNATPAQPDKIAEAALVLVQIETDWFARGEDMGPMPGWWALKRLRALAGKGE